MKNKTAVIVALSSPIFASVMSTVMLSMVYSDLGQVFGMSLGEMQSRNIAFFALFAGLLPYFGKLSDRRDPLIQLRVGTILFALFSCASLVAIQYKSWPLFLFCQSGMAVADAIMVPAVIRLIGLCFANNERGWAFGCFSACLSAATLAGPALTGLVSTAWDWRLIFPVLAAVPVLALLATFVVLPKTERASSTLPALPGLFGSICLTGVILFLQTNPWIALACAAFLLLNEKRGSEEARLFPASLWRNSGFLIASAGVFGIFVISNATGQFTPTWLREVMGFSTAQVSWVLIADSVLILALGPWAGRWIDRSLGTGLLVGLSFSIVAMAALLSTPIAAGVIYFMGVYLIFGVASAFVGPALNTLAMSQAPEKQAGAYMGVFQFLQFSSGALSAGVISQIASGARLTEQSSQWMYGSGAVVYGAMFLIFALYFFWPARTCEA